MAAEPTTGLLVDPSAGLRSHRSGGRRARREQVLRTGPGPVAPVDHGAQGPDHRAARAQRRRQDHRHPGGHRCPDPRQGHGPDLRLRSRPLRRGGAPPLRGGLGQAGPLRPALGVGQPAVLRRALRPGPQRHQADPRRGGPLRHPGRARPARGRLLDRHEDPAGPGPLGAARSRAPALRRAHLRARSRVVPRRAGADPGDDRRWPHRGHVHPPAGRGRRSGRPDRGAGERHRPHPRHAGGADPALLAGQPGALRRRGPVQPRGAHQHGRAWWPSSASRT